MTNTYFITGATGVLGSAIVYELLMKTHYRLVLLIRAKNDVLLKERFEQLLKFLEIDIAGVMDRVEVIRGDVELQNFGFSTEDYTRLSASVSHIIHSAASVHMNLPLDVARRAAVESTKNILQFAQLCQKNAALQKIEMVSTVGVGGRWQGPLPERWLNESRIFHNTYEQAKAEAEAIMEQYVHAGFPLTVHRPSMIIGNSKTGHILYFQIFYYLIEFISGRRTLGFLPNFHKNHVDLVPSDYVARAIIWSSLNPDSKGRVFHLCAGPENVFLLEDIRTRVLEKFHAYNIPTPTGIFLPAILLRFIAYLITPFVPKHQKKALSTLPIFLDYLSEKQVFNNKETRILLESHNILLPNYDILLEKVLDYYFYLTYSEK